MYLYIKKKIFVFDILKVLNAFEENTKKKKKLQRHKDWFYSLLSLKLLW